MPKIRHLFGGGPVIGCLQVLEVTVLYNDVVTGWHYAACTKKVAQL